MAKRAALALALLLTLGAGALHLDYHRHAGALWRDEVNSVNVVSGATTAEVYEHLPYDSFPPVWITTLYGWKLAGLGGDDEAYRRIGLLIGLAMIAAAWWTATKLDVGPPLVTLLLFGLCPSIIVYGDMVRGYGLAALAILLCIGALWSFVQSPTWARYLAAQLAFIFAAQAHFANSVLLLAIGVGGALVAWRRRRWQLVLATLAIGAVAALLLVVVNDSTLAYMGSTATQERGRWRTLGELFAVFAAALSPDGSLLLAVWVVAALAALAGVALAWRSPAVEGERATFAASTAALALGGAFAAYLMTRLPTQAWHYLSLIAVCAVACEIGIHLLAKSIPRGDWLRLGAVALAAVAIAPGVSQSVRMRMTSVDLAAEVIEQQGRAGDLVVVFPWYAGISFHRYYRGPAPWITLPEIPEHLFHLHLVVRDKMQLGDAAVAPELARVEQTLRAGGRVWVIGDLVAPNPGEPLPPLPSPIGSGNAGLYLNNWEAQLGAMLEQHAGQGHRVPLSADVPVNVWENLPLFVVEGWR